VYQASFGPAMSLLHVDYVSSETRADLSLRVAPDVSVAAAVVAALWRHAG